jgi:hypothetical protein
MRKEYGKILRSYFSSQLEKHAPQFKAIKVDSVYFWPGDRAYCWQPHDNLKCWLILSPSKKDNDEFTVLIGWSKLNRYPELNMVPCPDGPTADREEHKRDEYLIRLPQLWTETDEWWVVRKFRPLRSQADLEASLKPIDTNTAGSTVKPLVDDAVEKIIHKGIPYLESLVNCSSP